MGLTRQPTATGLDLNGHPWVGDSNSNPSHPPPRVPPWGLIWNEGERANKRVCKTLCAFQWLEALKIVCIGPIIPCKFNNFIYNKQSIMFYFSFKILPGSSKWRLFSNFNMFCLYIYWHIIFHRTFCDMGISPPFSLFYFFQISPCTLDFLYISRIPYKKRCLLTYCHSLLWQWSISCL